MSLKCKNAPQRQCRIHRTPSFRFPLLRRGNRADFRFPSRSGGNLKEGGEAAWKGDDLIFEAHMSLKCKNAPQRQCRIHRTPSLRFPLLRRGNRADFRFPSRSGGNLKEGGKTVWKGDYLIFEGLKSLL